MVALSWAGLDRLEEAGAWLLERLPPWLPCPSSSQFCTDAWAAQHWQRQLLGPRSHLRDGDRSPDHVSGLRWALLLDPLRAPSRAPHAFSHESLQGSCVQQQCGFALASLTSTAGGVGRG